MHICLSNTTTELFVLLYHLTTIDRDVSSYSIVWKTLPVYVQSLPSISTFSQWLKTLLFLSVSAVIS